MCEVYTRMCASVAHFPQAFALSSDVRARACVADKSTAGRVDPDSRPAFRELGGHGQHVLIDLQTAHIMCACIWAQAPAEAWVGSTPKLTLSNLVSVSAAHDGNNRSRTCALKPTTTLLGIYSQVLSAHFQLDITFNKQVLSATEFVFRASGRIVTLAGANCEINTFR